MLWLFFSIILFVISFYLFRKSMQFQKDGVKVTAVIEKIDVSHRKKKRQYYPVFRFEANGTNWLVKSNHGGGQWKNMQGMNYDIYYDPKDPMRIQIPDFSGVLFWTVFFSCMGAVCLTIGLWKGWYTSFYKG